MTNEFSPTFERYLQGVERNENPKPPKQPPFAQSDPPTTSGRRRTRKISCAIPDCSHRVYRVAAFPLCTDHLLRVWSFVQGSSEIQGSATRPWSDVKWRPGDPVPDAITPQEREARELAKRQQLREAATTPGHLYVLDTRDGLVKIGWTGRELWDRLSQYPPTFRLIVSIPGTRADERDTHRSLKLARARGREWYNVTPEVVRLINLWISTANTATMQRHNDRVRDLKSRMAEGDLTVARLKDQLDMKPIMIPRFVSLEDWEDQNPTLKPTGTESSSSFRA